MDERSLKELQIQNLLNVIDIKIQCESAGIEIKDTKTEKVLNYIFDREMAALQFDIALFPKKQEVREYKFHEL